MTYNPATLRALGTYWTDKGGVNLGVVGDDAHARRASYHNGKDVILQYNRLSTDYTVRTARDKAGLTNAASAIDLGRLDGSLANLRKFSVWLVEQCRKNVPGTQDIRDVIYTDDGKRVLRWDRERGYASAPRTGEADTSHLWHTHISYYRDSEARNKVALFAGYFGGIGMETFVTHEVPQVCRLTPDAKMFEDSAMTKVAWADLSTKLPDGTDRWFFYVGGVNAKVRLVAYEPVTGDADSSSRVYFVKAEHILEQKAMQLTPPNVPDQAVIDAAKKEAAAAATATEKERAAAIRDAAVQKLREI